MQAALASWIPLFTVLGTNYLDYTYTTLVLVGLYM